MTNDQKQHWDEVYAKNPEFFGDEPSIFARQALELFRENGVSSLLELGPGQGRDTVFFAENGIAVTGLDYSKQSISELNAKATARGLASKIGFNSMTCASRYRFLMRALVPATHTCSFACT